MLLKLTLRNLESATAFAEVSNKDDGWSIECNFHRHCTKGTTTTVPLQFTITTLSADKLAGVSQFFHCSSLFIGEGHQVPVASRVPLHGVDHEPAKIRRLGGLLLSCYVLPLCVTTICIAIAFCIWVHEMRIQASSAERDSLLLCPYTVHRHCVGNWTQN